MSISSRGWLFLGAPLLAATLWAGDANADAAGSKVKRHSFGAAPSTTNVASWRSDRSNWARNGGAKLVAQPWAFWLARRPSTIPVDGRTLGRGKNKRGVGAHGQGCDPLNSACLDDSIRQAAPTSVARIPGLAVGNYD